MKKFTLPPVFIVIASALYFLLASAAPAQEPVTESMQDNKPVKYCASVSNGNTIMSHSDGNQVSEPIAFMNGASVSQHGIIAWKAGSKTTLHNGDCIGVDILGAVYVEKALVRSEKEKEDNSGITSRC